MLFILVPSGALAFFGIPLGTTESTVLGLATLAMLIGGILLIVFGGKPGKPYPDKDQYGDHTLG